MGITGKEVAPVWYFMEVLVLVTKGSVVDPCMVNLKKFLVDIGVPLCGFAGLFWSSG